jgi:4-diphosphocytidyl-2-C-methyl-D-erythritol kinase
LIVYPNCKINLGLHIVSKRTDGYHNLETIFYPLPLFDVMELLDTDETRITTMGVPIPGKPEDNVVLKAYNLLKTDFPQLPPVHFYLLKNIPTGAGLGAGSANGAFTLMALNNKFALKITTEQLLNYALQLGSDCPFFIKNSPCFATGRGENFSPIPVDLSAYKILIVNPGIHISTSWAFSKLCPKQPHHSLPELISNPVNTWKSIITNDFESVVFQAYPEIENIKMQLYECGAVFSLLSGSGSTVYALFNKDQNNFPVFPQHYFVTLIEPEL